MCEIPQLLTDAGHVKFNKNRMKEMTAARRRIKSLKSHILSHLYNPKTVYQSRKQIHNETEIINARLVMKKTLYFVCPICGKKIYIK
jgi:transcription initiation factor IIE alpha subunit